MRLESVFLMVFLVILAVSSSRAIEIQRVKASGTIFIRADGSIDPPTANMSTIDNVTYTFTDNIFDLITVERNNIVIDGDGYTLQGTGFEPGIVMIGRTNVTIENMRISTFRYGVYSESSSDIMVSGNNMTNNGSGVYVINSSDNTVSGNRIEASEHSNSSGGVWLYVSSGNTVSGNIFVDCGLSVLSSYGNVVIDNLVNGKPLVYLEGVSDFAVGEDAGQVMLVSCNRIRVENLSLSHVEYALELQRTNNTAISRNNITDNSFGVRLIDSSDNTVSGNNLASNFWFGVCLESSSGNAISGNNISSKHINGVRLDESSNNNTISGNNVTDNDSGVYLGLSSNNTISGNNLTDNYFGIYLDIMSNGNTVSGNNVISNNNTGVFISYHSSANIVSGNNIASNGDYGVRLVDSSGNTISGNNITNSWGGIRLENCLGINIVNNDITDNDLAGIWLFFSTSGLVSQNRITGTHTAGIILDISSNNTILENDVRDNHVNMVFEYSVNDGVALSSHNRIFHNNFINGTWNAITHFSGQPENFWDDGHPSGGNYWSDYNGTDLYSGSYQNETGSDGIGDTSYFINYDNIDRYPLSGMFNNFNVSWVDSGYSVDLISNSTVSGFDVGVWIEHPENPNTRIINFNVTGADDTVGFCRILIPTALMNGTYTVFVNGLEVASNLLPGSNSTHSYLYFNYAHSTQEVTIIPEFPSFLILPLISAATLLAVAICRRKRR